MPIFRKAGMRVYFVHMPKTAGGAICLAFLRSGWTISNLQSKNREGRIGRVLAQEFGITEIPFEGERGDLDIVAQHAPSRVWSKWGPFDTTFAICRNPYDRYLSSVTYHYHIKRRIRPEWMYRRGMVRLLRRGLDTNGEAARPFFRPQVDYLSGVHRLFRYEEDWASQLVEAFDLQPLAMKPYNVGRRPKGDLSDGEMALVNDLYARDFEQLGYEIQCVGSSSSEVPVEIGV